MDRPSTFCLFAISSKTTTTEDSVLANPSQHDAMLSAFKGMRAQTESNLRGGVLAAMERIGLVATAERLRQAAELI